MAEQTETKPGPGPTRQLRLSDEADWRALDDAGRTQVTRKQEQASNEAKEGGSHTDNTRHAQGGGKRRVTDGGGGNMQQPVERSKTVRAGRAVC